MNKIFSVVCFLLLSVSICGKAQTQHTFNFYFEDAASHKVEVECEHVPTFTLEPTDSNHLSATISGMESDMYTYAYKVDGIRMLDEQNIQTVRDGHTYFNYFIVEGGRGDMYKQQVVPHGTVEQTWYKAKDDRQRAVTVYLPPTYQSGKQYYPVLYLFHGSYGDEYAWFEMGRLAQIMDNLIAQGKAKEMIVVMPNCNFWQRQSPSVGEPELWESDIEEVSRKMTDGNFEEDFGNMLNQIEMHYRIITKKHSRAIAGLSRGGYYAYHVSHYYNTMFDYIGLFSATYRTLSTKIRAYKNIDKDLARLFAGKPALYYVAIGKNDFLYEENVNFLRMLDSRKYPYVYNESEGGHEWRNWRAYMLDFLPRLF